MSEQNDAATDTDLMVFPKLDGDLMSKADIVAHLMDVHGYVAIQNQRLAPTMKMSKADLISFHEQVHEILDRVGKDPLVEVDLEQSVAGRNRKFASEYSKTKEEARGYRRPRLARVMMPDVEHRHELIEDIVSDEVKAQASRARNNEPVSDKPLSVQERKVLKELVDNDFNALKSEMRQFAADALAVACREVEGEWQDKVKAAPKFGVKYTELRRKQEAEMSALKAKHADAQKALLDEAADAGVVINERQSILGADGNSIYATEVKGLKDALAKVEADNKAMLERALMTLERQRLTAQRQVLVSGVSKEAATILDTVPEAKTLMVEAQQKQNSLTV